MRRILLFAAAASIPSQSFAQVDCYLGGFGPYGSKVPAWLLVMNKPTVKSLKLIDQPVFLKKGLAIATQEYAIAPRTRFLGAPVSLKDEKGNSLADAVPLGAGAPITTWRGADGDERHCSIGWKSGPLGGSFGHFRWVCFEDKDGDGRIDNAWLPRTKNLGLSYKRYDMPVSPQVALLDQAPAGTEVVDGRGPLDSYPAYRRVELSGLSPKKIKLKYWGAGVAQQEISVDLDQNKSVELGGININLLRNEKGLWVVRSSGDFKPQSIMPVCSGYAWSIDGFDSRVMFPFPDW